MKKYLYLISFIVISVAFSGCFNERSISSSDNQTEDSYIVSENKIDKNIDNSSDNSNILNNAESNSVISNSNDSIQNRKLHSIDNKSIIQSPN